MKRRKGHALKHSKRWWHRFQGAMDREWLTARRRMTAREDFLMENPPVRNSVIARMVFPPMCVLRRRYESGYWPWAIRKKGTT